MFWELTPAKWKVFRVICVKVSPNDYAAIEPHISPGLIRDFIKSFSIWCITKSKAQLLSLCLRITFLLEKLYNTKAQNKYIALWLILYENILRSLAWLILITSSLLNSSVILSMTVIGLRSVTFVGST